MKYHVRWTPDAENELAAVWLQATDRKAVTKAAHEIDLRLGKAAGFTHVDFRLKCRGF